MEITKKNILKHKKKIKDKKQWKTIKTPKNIEKRL